MSPQSKTDQAQCISLTVNIFQSPAGGGSLSTEAVGMAAEILSAFLAMKTIPD